MILTNDQDFLRLAEQASANGETFAPILFWPQQHRSIGQLISRIIPIANSSDDTMLCNRVFFL
jgi:hypothetical protein